jgi:hypothetical protein
VLVSAFGPNNPSPSVIRERSDFKDFRKENHCILRACRVFNTGAVSRNAGIRMAASLQSKNCIPLAVLLILVLANVAALQIAKEYPFTDLPNHLAEAAIFRSSNDSTDVLTKFFRCEDTLWKPNTGHLILYSLFQTVESANAVYYSLYMISVPLLIAGLIWLCGGDLWVSILSCLTLYNHNTCLGFLGFTLSIPLVLLYLGIHILFITSRSRVAGISLSLVMIALFYMHVLAFLFAILCFFAIEFCELWYSRKQYSWTSLLVVMPGAVFFLVWRYYGEEFSGCCDLNYLIDYYSNEYFALFPRRLIDAFFYSNHVWLQHGFYKILGSVFSFCILGWFLCVRKVGKPESQVEVKARRATICFTSAAVLCYSILPSELPGQTLLYERYLVFVFLGFICILGWGVAERFRRALKISAILVTSVYFVLWAVYLEGFQGWVADFNKIMDNPELKVACMPGFIIDDAKFAGPETLIEWNNAALFHFAKVMQRTNFDRTRLGSRLVEVSGRFRGHPALIHFNNFHIVRHKGITPSCIVDYRFGAVRRRVSKEVLPSYVEWIDKYTDFVKLSSKYRVCDYIVTHGRTPFTFFHENTSYTMVQKLGDWALFRNTSCAATIEREERSNGPVLNPLTTVH